MQQPFEIFLSQLFETNSTLESLTDFSKVSSNVAKIELKLNQLNYLIGKKDLKFAIAELFKENPKAFDILEILVAIRKSDGKMVLNKDLQPKLLKSYFVNVNDIYDFFEKTGLSEIFHSKKIKNLVDYVFGIEVGLDTNARKNRSGYTMENTVAKILSEAKIPFEQEVNSTNFEEIKSLGVDLKRFDFVIETPRKTYLIETNFYNSGGSKLNETARSYSDISLKINQYEKFEFVWITDGQGWLYAKNKLEEAFSIIPNIYNLTSMKEFIKKIKNEITNQLI